MEDKYAELRQQATSAINFDLDTDAIIARLAAWDAAYGIELSDIAPDAVTVEFKRLPEDLDALAREIYDFCPDTIDQHFGVFDEIIESFEAQEGEAPEWMAKLVEGVDLDDPDFGLELLKRSLAAEKAIGLWWD